MEVRGHSLNKRREVLFQKCVAKFPINDTYFDIACFEKKVCLVNPCSLLIHINFVFLTCVSPNKSKVPYSI